MQTPFITADLTQGPDLCQGDLVLTRLNDLWPAVAKAVSRSEKIREPADGDLRLLEGEVTGHHHAIAVLDRPVAAPRFPAVDRLIDDALANRIATGHAMLVRDDNAAQALVRAGCLTRADLALGFLIVEGGPVDLRHPEHNTIRVPEGVYYVGRQIESAGAEERVVRD